MFQNIFRKKYVVIYFEVWYLLTFIYNVENVMANDRYGETYKDYTTLFMCTYDIEFAWFQYSRGNWPIISSNLIHLNGVIDIMM